MEGAPRHDGGSDDASAQGYRYKVFLQYYSIGVKNRKNPKPNRKPKSKDELKGHQEPPHSILGIVAQSMERFSASKHYILWKLSYAELLAMNMDVSRYVSAEEEKEHMAEKSKNDPEGFTTEYYQTKLGL